MLFQSYLGIELPVSNVKLFLLINMSLSEAALRKLTKDAVIALSLEYQEKFDNTLSNTKKDRSELCNDFKKIESELSASENVNSKLHNEWLHWRGNVEGNSQYYRRDCLEITGVPDSISNDDLEI